MAELTFPARGTWIERFQYGTAGPIGFDVPRKGNVDRKIVYSHMVLAEKARRSPQGERG